MHRIDGSGNLHRAQRALCNLGGCDGDGVGEESKRELLYVYIQLIHFLVQRKLTQHRKAIILQLKKQQEQFVRSWTRSPTSHLGAIGSVPPTGSCSATPFSRPLVASFSTRNFRSICVLLFIPGVSLRLLFLSDRYCH